MRRGIIIIALLLLATMATAVDTHFSAGMVPIGWHVTDKGLIKGSIGDANAPAILVSYQEINPALPKEQALAAYLKSLSKTYSKVKDLGPCSVAGYGTEGYETTDLTGTMHRFYLITAVAGKAWTVEVRAKTTAMAGIEAEVGNILANMKLN
jgi:hypothetical protein